MTTQMQKDPMVAELILAEQALESWRDSGFDLATAAGEPVDNSIEANARFIRIKTIEGKNDEGRKVVEKIIFADDGVGIQPEILARTLQMGFSTRYNQRKGLGRFGVGLKLAGLSQAKRIEIYTRPIGSDKYFYTFLDLDMVADKSQKDIRAVAVEGYPAEYEDLMQYPDGTPFASGTLVIWSKVDRIVDGGRYGTSIKERIDDLVKFLARAYRKFIDNGLHIELNGKKIELHDPLFLLENPRATKIFGEDLRAEIIDAGKIQIDGHEVEVTVTLLPEIVRKKKGEGARKGSASRFKELEIFDNEGKISILRNGREIYYNIIPKMLPGGVKEQDRYIGIEVSFPAELDEYFQVRHVKRGAEPVSKLREELREFLKKPVIVARNKIAETWEKTDREERKISKDHAPATKAVQKVEETAPKGKGGFNVRPEEAQKIITDVLEDLGIDEASEQQAAEEIKQQIQEQSITIVDGSWPGKELLEIIHLNGRAILKINHRHPFIRDIYEPIKKYAGTDPASVDPADLVQLVRKVEGAIDVLLMAYAKAENMHPNPEDAYADLRSYWGQFSAAYVRELLKNI
ncbi:ATP-binding protein [Desulfofundulus thermocisternus]|uniref:ATP-binding protein n=1 Tax=Desulfofundulus thermocisternus TaxID=42471 RepID=UPI00048A1A69|nr:ATP-binding protein [Desulfofundulus thermocisternus]